MDTSDADKLLRAVHERLGGLGVDIKTFGDGVVEVSWRRSYDGGWSDLRTLETPTLTGALRSILIYENEADEADAREEAREAAAVD